jgi:hypothetical protein
MNRAQAYKATEGKKVKYKNWSGNYYVIKEKFE